MAITKKDIESISIGSRAVFACNASEYCSAKATIWKCNLIAKEKTPKVVYKYTTNFDKKEMTVTSTLIKEPKKIKKSKK